MYSDSTKITEVNLSVFIHRLFHEDVSPIVRTNLDPNLRDDWRDIFMKH